MNKTRVSYLQCRFMQKMFVNERMYFPRNDQNDNYYSKNHRRKFSRCDA